MVIQRIIVSTNWVSMWRPFLWRKSVTFNSCVIIMMLCKSHKITKSFTKFWNRIKRRDRSNRCPADTNKGKQFNYLCFWVVHLHLTFNTLKAILALRPFVQCYLCLIFHQYVIEIKFVLFPKFTNSENVLLICPASQHYVVHSPWTLIWLI